MSAANKSAAEAVKLGLQKLLADATLRHRVAVRAVNNAASEAKRAKAEISELSRLVSQIEERKQGGKTS